MSSYCIAGGTQYRYPIPVAPILGFKGLCIDMHRPFFVSFRPPLVRRKGQAVKIKYTFITGETTEVEVSDEIGAVITASRKAEHALEERNRYHCYSLNAIDYEGLEYGECDEYPIEDDSAERTERIKAAFGKLTETQQRRLGMYADGKTLREIAALENTRFQSVAESIEAAKKKFLKNYCPTP